MLPHCK